MVNEANLGLAVREIVREVTDGRISLARAMEQIIECVEMPTHSLAPPRKEGA
jgi:hypothetical protein